VIRWKEKLYEDIASRPPPPGKAKARSNESKKHDPKGLQMARLWKKVGNSVKGKGYKEVINTDKYTNLVAAGNEICAAFMLRRTLETKDPWGKRISALPGVFHVVIRPCRNDKWAEIVENGR
jgi:HD superfamily phosphodiesterase